MDCKICGYHKDGHDDWEGWVCSQCLNDELQTSTSFHEKTRQDDEFAEGTEEIWQEYCDFDI